MRRRFPVLEVVVALLLVVVVFAALAAVLARTYPEAARRIGLQVVSRNPSWAGPLGDLGRRVGDEEWQIRERWRVRVIDPVKAMFSSEATPTTPVDETSPWQGCVECHPNYATRPLFSVVYMPHTAHAENDITCERCHDAEGPTRDKPPSMKGCSECHTVTGRDSCADCHPPGSIFHGAEMAGNREIGSECYTCHTPRSLTTRARSHDMPELDRDACARCHETVSFCSACHPPTHGAGYANSHAHDFRSARARHQACWTCHDSKWCAMRCHAGVRR